MLEIYTGALKIPRYPGIVLVSEIKKQQEIGRSPMLPNPSSLIFICVMWERENIYVCAYLYERRHIPNTGHEIYGWRDFKGDDWIWGRI